MKLSAYTVKDLKCPKAIFNSNLAFLGSQCKDQEYSTMTAYAKGENTAASCFLGTRDIRLQICNDSLHIHKHS